MIVNPQDRRIELVVDDHVVMREHRVASLCLRDDESRSHTKALRQESRLLLWNSRVPSCTGQAPVAM